MSLAGPGTNFAMALAAAGLGRGLVALGVRNAYVLAFVALIVLLSLVLGLFNLLPVPLSMARRSSPTSFPCGGGSRFCAGSSLGW